MSAIKLVLAVALVAAAAPSCTSLDDVTAPPCVFALSSASASFGSDGGTGTVGVRAATSCQWSVKVSDPWISLQSPASGSGDATITFAIDTNASTSTRTARMDVSGQAFTVSQSGTDLPPPDLATCTYITSPGSASFAASGGSDRIEVTADAGCVWTATTQANWITITSGSGNGNGVVSYAVAGNSSAERSGIVDVAGRTVTISQAGRTCTFTVSRNSIDFGRNGGERNIDVRTDPGCAWTATTNTSWISITEGASGTGNGRVRIAVAPNTTRDEREGSIVIAGRTIRVEQND